MIKQRFNFHLCFCLFVIFLYISQCSQGRHNLIVIVGAGYTLLIFSIITYRLLCLSYVLMFYQTHYDPSLPEGRRQ